MRKKLIAGAAVLALLMNVPQVKADDNIVVFGGEFEDEDKPAPKTIKKPEPIRELPPPKEEPAPIEEEQPEIDEPQELPPPQPLESERETEDLKQEPPQEVSLPEENDDDLGDKLVFDDLKPSPEQVHVEQPLQEQPITEEPPIVENPAHVDEPFETSSTVEIDRPFEQPHDISNKEPIIVVPPQPPQPEFTSPEPPLVEYQPPVEEKPVRRYSSPRNTAPQKDLKMLKTRFVKLAVDETYIYYLDKNSVQWKKMPYSTSEYIADIWVRMIEREPKELDEDMEYYGADNFNAEISLAREQGYQYSPEDVQVLRNQNYVLEHYYLRPKTKQIQFLCELEVFGRPQNTISERAYDYRNWENLVPGSVESVIYEATIKVIGTYKSTERGHMTFIDMVEEYGRISLR